MSRRTARSRRRPSTVGATHPTTTTRSPLRSPGGPGITIVKDAQPNTSHPFGFTLTGGGLNTGFTLVDDGTNTANVMPLYNLSTGQTYTITELQPTDGSYALRAITCTGGGTGTTILARSLAAITLAEGESVVCTFVNGAITPGGASVGSGSGSGGLAFTGSQHRTPRRGRRAARGRRAPATGDRRPAPPSARAPLGRSTPRRVS